MVPTCCCAAIAHLSALSSMTFNEGRLLLWWHQHLTLINTYINAANFLPSIYLHIYYQITLQGHTGLSLSVTYAYEESDIFLQGNAKCKPNDLSRGYPQKMGLDRLAYHGMKDKKAPPLVILVIV